MNALQLAGFAVCAAAIALVMRKLRPEAATALVIGAGTMTTLALIPQLSQIVTGILSLAEAGGVRDEYLSQLMKVGGISLLSDFAAQTCRDAGEEGLAAKTELAGRIMLVSLALPVMCTLLEQILSLSP